MQENFGLIFRSLNFSTLTFRITHKNRGLVGGLLDIFSLASKFQNWRAILTFLNLWALSDREFGCSRRSEIKRGRREGDGKKTSHDDL